MADNSENRTEHLSPDPGNGKGKSAHLASSSPKPLTRRLTPLSAYAESETPARSGPKTTLPYTSIFAPLSDFYLPDVPIEAKIINYEENRSVLSLSQYLYHIELRHGNFSWIIKRRYNHFRALHNQIWLFYTTLTLPLPTQNSRVNRKVLAKIGDIEFPKFPMIPETIFLNQGINKRIKLLEEYLQFILSLSLFKQHPSVLNFLQVSPFSFIEDLGYKGEEFLVKKRAGGFRKATFCTRVENFFTDFTGHWRNRWLIVKDTCLFYYRPKDKKIRYVMLIDQDFYADSGLQKTGVQHGVRITNMSRQLVIKTKNAKELAEYLNNYARKYAFEFISSHRFGSFAPIRKNAHCQWFVDASAHFEAVSQAIDMAQEEIYIADWWLSPEIYLKRPSLTHRWRLDKLLEKKAREGVRIFILLYKEMEIGVSINSVYTKRTLMKSHKNISVLRHPDAVRGGPLLWSHHEKLVIIDQKWAFVGGIDLCFGRYDNFEHKLTDQGGIYYKNTDETIVIHNSTKPTGLTYRSASQPFLVPQDALATPPRKSSDGFLLVPNNALFQAINSTTKLVDDKSDKSSDTSSERNNNNEDGLEEITEDGGKDQVDSPSEPSTTERKHRGRLYTGNLRNRISTKIRNKRMAAISKFRKINRRIRNRINDSSGLDNISYISTDVIENNLDFIKQQIPRIKADADHVAADELEGAAKLWIGKDYTNFIVKDFTNLNMPFQDSIDRHTTPRMPWHDVSCIVDGAAARDVARHFIQRWNYTKFSKAKFDDRYPWLIPKTYSNVNQIEVPPFLLRTHKVTCQVLRSVSSWSIGVKKTEASIVDAYIEAISNAEHYIYIENQFFISQTKTHLESEDRVRNRIAEALYRRIIRAHRNRQTFRVFVLIPLLPAFEGEIGTSSGTPIQQITHYNYSTICKGGHSLMGKLKQEIDDPSRYIGFYSLRNHDELNGRLVTELVYIHSKMLIADDNVTIIGSANINDRSMLGARDSEVAVIIEDEEFENHPTPLNGKPYRSGRFSGSLRRMLMREHLGIYKKSSPESSPSHSVDRLPMDAVNDPTCDHFWNDIWNGTARVNTLIYEQVFPVIPTDDIKSFSQIPEYLEKAKLCKVDKAKAQERLASVQGHLVYLPLEFLSRETSPINAYNPQDHFIPEIIWT